MRSSVVWQSDTEQICSLVETVSINVSHPYVALTKGSGLSSYDQKWDIGSWLLRRIC